MPSFYWTEVCIKFTGIHYSVIYILSNLLSVRPLSEESLVHLNGFLALSKAHLSIMLYRFGHKGLLREKKYDPFTYNQTGTSVTYFFSSPCDLLYRLRGLNIKGDSAAPPPFCIPNI